METSKRALRRRFLPKGVSYDVVFYTFVWSSYDTFQDYLDATYPEEMLAMRTAEILINGK